MKRALALLLSLILFTGCTDEEVAVSSDVPSVIEESNAVTTTTESVQESFPLEDTPLDDRWIVPTLVQGQIPYHIEKQVDKETIIQQAGYGLTVDLSQYDGYKFAKEYVEKMLLEDSENEEYIRAAENNYSTTHVLFYYVGSEYADWVAIVYYYFFEEVIMYPYYTRAFLVKDNAVVKELCPNESIMELETAGNSAFFSTNDGVGYVDCSTGEVRMASGYTGRPYILNVSERYAAVGNWNGMTIDVYDAYDDRFISTELGWTYQMGYPEFDGDWLNYSLTDEWSEDGYMIMRSRNMLTGEDIPREYALSSPACENERYKAEYIIIPDKAIRAVGVTITDKESGGEKTYSLLRLPQELYIADEFPYNSDMYPYYKTHEGVFISVCGFSEEWLVTEVYHSGWIIALNCCDGRVAVLDTDVEDIRDNLEYFSATGEFINSDSDVSEILRLNFDGLA